MRSKMGAAKARAKEEGRGERRQQRRRQRAALVEAQRGSTTEVWSLEGGHHGKVVS